MALSNTFVFVVCGADEHITTLNFSIRALKKYTVSPILVVTDLARNTKKIEHEHVIHIDTPKAYDHHQASIYLKTSLNRLLPEGPLYCYLDTDVLCLSKRVNKIFSHFTAPVTFAWDHCNMRRFSPSAIWCNCVSEHYPLIKAAELEVQNAVEVYGKSDQVHAQKKEQIVDTLTAIRKRKMVYALFALKFNLARNVFKLNDDLFYNKKIGYWFDASKQPVLFDRDSTFKRYLDEEKGIYWENKYERWNRREHDIYELEGCDHLRDEIKTTFNIDVSDKGWNHWNGGVFIFY
jgi:hypothetical protein